MTDSFYFQNLKIALIEASDSETFEDSRLEWSVSGVRLHNPGHCICTHPIVENCILDHKDDPTRQIIVGNCCVRMFFPEAERLKMEEMYKEVKNKTRVCALCEKRYRKEDCLNDEVCDYCHLMNKKCETCKKYFHCEDTEERKWKKLCMPCWQESKGLKVTTSTQHCTSRRKTRDCLVASCKARIKRDEPDWKVYCKKHYKERKNNLIVR